MHVTQIIFLYSGFILNSIFAQGICFNLIIIYLLTLFHLLINLKDLRFIFNYANETPIIKKSFKLIHKSLINYPYIHLKLINLFYIGILINVFFAIKKNLLIFIMFYIFLSISYVKHILR